jgi:hypothetical protein
MSLNQPFSQLLRASHCVSTRSTNMQCKSISMTKGISYDLAQPLLVNHVTGPHVVNWTGVAFEWGGQTSLSRSIDQSHNRKFMS